MNELSLKHLKGVVSTLTLLASRMASEPANTPPFLQTHRASVIRSNMALVQAAIDCEEMPNGTDRDGKPLQFPGYHVKPPLHDPATCNACLTADDQYSCTCGAGCAPGMCSDEREDLEHDPVELEGGAS